ncbi:MAG: glycosyltransferase, partial [Tsuneonella sp.]
MQGAELPAFSVIVPTHQRRDLVCDVVRALDALECPREVEVIVVVDGSTDGTASALGTLGLRRVPHVIEQANRGAAAA